MRGLTHHGFFVSKSANPTDKAMFQKPKPLPVAVLTGAKHERPLTPLQLRHPKRRSILLRITFGSDSARLPALKAKSDRSQAPK